MSEIWVADDDRGVRFVLAEALRDAGHNVREFSAGDAVRAALAGSRPDLLVTDVRMPGEDGLHLLEYLTRRNIGPVIVMSAYTDVATTAAAYRAGAADYIAKPFDLDLAVQAVERALAAAREEVVVPVMRAETHALLGESAAMREVFRLIGRVASTELPVLIVGETGTGKELVARALHDESARGGKPYVVLNTAAIPADMLESELFGHEVDAFADAPRRHAGRYEQAEGGTLFLDEVGDMPPALQTHLLRVLAGGEYYRVGGREGLCGNVRIVAATHQDLDARVAGGQFRADLKHRLDVVRIELPPLRDRRDDIPLLAKHFLTQAAAELNLPPKRFSRGAMRLLEQREYPGNVRELENLCRRLAVIAPGVEIQAKDLGGLPAGQPRGADWTEALRLWAQDALAHGEPDIHTRAREALDKTLLQVALIANDGHRQNAAAALGVGRNTLTRKLGASRKRRPSNG